MKGLYIHYPFCSNLCYYCHFIKTIYKEEKNKKYIKTLQREIKNLSSLNYTFDTLYFGGGTPSLLNKGLIKIINTINNYLNGAFEEISLEANPEDINNELVKIIDDVGITRVSIGIQQVDERLLKILGRKHIKREIIKAINFLRKKDFILNYDFIIGIPTEKEKDIYKIIEFIAEYEPDSVSIYILENIRGKYWDKFSQLDEDVKIKHFNILEEYFESVNIKRYEISNFAKKDKESIHNLKYWNYTDFIGIGPSAFSLIDNKRWQNVNSFDIWVNSVLNNKSYKTNIIKLSNIERAKEALMMGLRKLNGININLFINRFKISPLNLLKEILNEKEEFFEIKNRNIKIKREHLFVFNSVLSGLF